jgi:tRNA A-37 threonylcarbamoyl transferase component Bud32
MSKGGGAVTRRTCARLAADDLVLGRHRLVREVSRCSGTTLWEAEDEVLARPVAVRALDDPDSVSRDPEAVEAEFLAAALRAGRVSDPRVASVYDAGDDEGLTVVVREWVDGQPLSRLLDEGPLPAAQAATIGLQIAAALGAAHARGAAHGALSPGDVVLTSGGVKVTDFEIGEALEGRTPAEDFAERVAADTRDLGAVLYATLTARWPGAAAHGLPAAPTTDDRPCTPHQVRAAVPRRLDVVVTRALDGDFATPDALAGALTPLAGFVSTGTALRSPVVPSSRATDATVATRLPDLSSPGAPTARSLSRVTGALVVLGLVAVAGWTAALVTGELPGSGSFGRDGASAASGPVAPVEVRPFDPPPGDGVEGLSEVSLAVDDDRDTAWTTDTYRGRPDLGGLKPGVGLLLDLGQPAELGSVQLVLESSGGAVEIRAGNDRPSAATDLELLAEADDPDEEMTFQVDSDEPARFVLVWFTSLPERGSGFGNGIRSVTVNGD